jgi:hypothetical protein
MPDRENGQRMVEEHVRLIEQHIADPPAEDDAERRPGEEVIDLQGRRDGGRPLRDPPHQAPAEHEAGDIGDGIPVDREGAEPDEDRIEVGKDERLHRLAPRWQGPIRRALVPPLTDPMCSAQRRASLLGL